MCEGFATCIDSFLCGYVSVQRKDIHSCENDIGRKWTVLIHRFLSYVERPCHLAHKSVVLGHVVTATYRNISKDQNKALNDLRNNRDIVIKEVDKGSSTVAQGRELYVQECTRQLDNTVNYKKLSKDPTSTYSKDVVKALDKACQVDLIDSEMNLTLRPKNPKPGRFYTLPKVHKPLVTVPTSRPIVGGNGTVTEKISLFLDHYLKPYVPKLRCYVQDDMDFLHKIETVNENGPLPLNDILATVDVSSLYTNIPTQEGIAACHAFLTQEFTTDQLNSFCELMEIVLTRKQLHI